jgi:hypothetical protein
MPDQHFLSEYFSAGGGDEELFPSSKVNKSFSHKKLFFRIPKYEAT